jgi:hypothetical protein
MFQRVDCTVEEFIDPRDPNSQSSIYERMGSAPAINASSKRAITNDERASWDALRSTSDVQLQYEKEGYRTPVSDDPTRIYLTDEPSAPTDDDYTPEGW